MQPPDIYKGRFYIIVMHILLISNRQEGPFLSKKSNKFLLMATSLMTSYGKEAKGRHYLVGPHLEALNMDILIAASYLQAAFHSGLVSRIIRYLDSVLLYVLKVRGSSGWIGTMCNQSKWKIDDLCT